MIGSSTARPARFQLPTNIVISYLSWSSLTVTVNGGSYNQSIQKNKILYFVSSGVNILSINSSQDILNSIFKWSYLSEGKHYKK